MSARNSIVLACCLLSTLARAQSRELNIMPLPAAYELGSGQLTVDGNFSVSLTGYQEPRLESAVQRFLHTLSRQTGMAIAPSQHSPATLTIHTGHASKPVQELGEDESYTLEIASTGATLSAPNPLGILHGLQTFLHLVQTTPAGFPP